MAEHAVMIRVPFETLDALTGDPTKRNMVASRCCELVHERAVEIAMLFMESEGEDLESTIFIPAHPDTLMLCSVKVDAAVVSGLQKMLHDILWEAICDVRKCAK